MAKRLRGIADLAAQPRVELLAEQADVVAQAEQVLEQLAGLMVLAGGRSPITA